MKTLVSNDLPFSIQIDFQEDKIQKVQLIPDTDGLVCLFNGSSAQSKASEEKVIAWLKQYAAGKEPNISLPLLSFGAAYTQLTLNTLQKVPFGSVVTYRELAEKTCNPRAARAVGNVCRGNPFPLFIPCHRVIHTSGKIGHFAFGSPLKKLLLDFESQS